MVAALVVSALGSGGRRSMSSKLGLATSQIRNQLELPCPNTHASYRNVQNSGPHHLNLTCELNSNNSEGWPQSALEDTALFTPDLILPNHSANAIFWISGISNTGFIPWFICASFGSSKFPDWTR